MTAPATEVADAPRPPRSLAVAVTVVAVLAAFVLYLTQSHRGLHENGPVLVELWRRGAVVHAHALVLPLARLVAALGLAGDPARPDAAIRLVSAAAAAMLVGLGAWRGVQRAGVAAGLLLAAVLGLAPSVRFFAGAVETRALAAGTAALAVVLAGRATRSFPGGIALTVLGVTLACASHASLVVLLPGLLVLRLSAEARAGRRAGVREAVVAGVTLLAAAAVTAGVVFAADQAFNPHEPSGSSVVWRYLRNASAWSEVVGRPSAGVWLAGEVLAPLGALVPLAAVGFVPLWRASRGEAMGHALLLGGLAAAAFSVGARQYGGYLLPAAFPLTCLAAEAVLHLRQAGRVLPVTLAVLALAFLGCGLASAVTPAERPGFATLGGTSWGQDPGDLSLVWLGPLPGVLAAVPMTAWLLGCLVLSLLAGAPRAAGARPAPVAALALLLVALAWQVAAGERFRTSWPRLWNEEVVVWSEAARRDLAADDLLLAAAPTPQLAWSITYEYGRPWIDLAEGARVQGPDAVERWLAECDARVAETLARGGRVVLAEDSLPVLAVEPRHQRALAALARWESAVPVWRWSPAAGLRR